MGGRLWTAASGMMAHPAGMWTSKACLILVACVVCAVRPPPVDVHKCCRIGDVLASDKSCRTGGGSLQWAPLIYAPQRRTYLAEGSVPAYWTVHESQLPNCSSPRLLLLEPVPSFVLYANGSLLVRESETILAPTTFCAETGAALVCEPDSESDGATPPAPGPRKCCGTAYAYSEQRRTCVAAPSASSSLSLLEALGAYNESRKALIGFPTCENGTYVVTKLPKGSRVLRNGAFSAPDARLPAEAYCVDWAAEGAHALVLACPAHVPTEPRDLRYTLYAVALLVSAAFLGVTLAAGFALPASHHALHWRCQTNYVASLLAGDVLLASLQLSAEMPLEACVTLAVAVHFLYLAAFFWLNTMCFNIWWTFRDFRPASADAHAERCRLRAYACYAWGGPLLVAGAALALDVLPEARAAGLLRPRFGAASCWFRADSEKLAFFYGPVGVLLAVNLALFVSTARQLTCGLWRRDELKPTSERAALGRVCAKLVVVMGVAWVADVVSWAAGGPHAIWYATDAVNALHGVFIFAVVGCQPQAWAAVRRLCRVTRRAQQQAPAHSSSQLPSCGDSLTHNTQAPACQAAAAPARETVC